jgi:hypothetical protein
MTRDAIAGVSPSAIQETTIVTVWPSIALYRSGQWLGRWFDIRWPNFYFLSLGNLFALLAIPHALVLYFLRIAPRYGTRYRLTNRRVIVERGLQGIPERAIALEAFDAIRADVRPGQSWYDAADVIFLSGEQEVFRLPGVSRPQAWMQTCRDAAQARCLVAAIQQRQSQRVASTTPAAG